MVQNRSLRLKGTVADGINASQRPDMVLFADREAHDQVLRAWGEEEQQGATPDGVAFCRSAALILDAKRFNKGVGADEGERKGSKRQRTEKTATEDVQQVGRYLRGYDRTWGILTNGRSWRLMRQGREHEHLRFDLVCFLEELRGRDPGEADMAVFGLFWHLFGFPGSAGGYLDALERESEASNRRVREILREQAHVAVETIARGFWSTADNRDAGLDVSPALPSQERLDHLREVSLTLLYRLLFLLKAEAQGLLRMRDDQGAETSYSRRRSSTALYKKLSETSLEDRRRFSDGYEALQTLFGEIDGGSRAYDIPAYNGGLFDNKRHPDLARWKLLDDALHEILEKLIYLDGDVGSPVPYADLDVRDLGDIYEGLLEQRLTAVDSDPPSLHLRNQKGERKASGSFFTPDPLVDHLVRRALVPLLEACDDDPERILELRILDPAMGSGHFLVKAVDVLADHLTVHCDPVDPDAPRDNGPAERAYWKRVVVEHCIYGVDSNPMAVELARVALWLHTAEFGRPLSFVDHHLKLGNSLVGATLESLSQPGLRSHTTSKKRTWKPVHAPSPEATKDASSVAPVAKKTKRGKKVPQAQLALPFSINTGLLSGILASIRTLLSRPSDKAEDVKAKGLEYARTVEDRLAAHRLLADVWCLQWFLGEPTDELVAAYERSDGLFGSLKRTCGIQVDEQRDAALAALSEHPLVQRIRRARGAGYGPRTEAFFHWQLAFPEVAFDEAGRSREGFGFDAVIGNPPWDRIRPERRHFYGPYGRPDMGPEWDVANSQAASLDKLIRRLHEAHPDLEEGWRSYDADIHALTAYLRDGGDYRHQVVELDGARTGGDPDLFRYFVERAFHAVRPGGRVALVVPGTLWQAQGCTGLRRLLLDDSTTEEFFVFENYRKWAFDIDSRFKFTTFVCRKEVPDSGHAFPAAFMLRDLRAVHGRLPERVVRMSRELANRLSPGTMAMLDFASDADAQLVGRLHREHPALGSPESGWDVKYRRELDMTNDAWRFKSREWMRERGFLCVRPVRLGEGWDQVREAGSPTAAYPDDLPPGGEYWVAANPDWYRARGYLEEQQDVGGDEQLVFIHPEDAAAPRERGVASEARYRIVPGGVYRPLYEGRLVHLLDHATKRYVSGEGRRAVWTDVGVEEKALIPRRFVYGLETGVSRCSRVGFCDVTGATNERTTLAAVLPKEHVAGNKVPILNLPADAVPVVAALLSSFVWDWGIRFRVSTTMNWTYVSRVVIPSQKLISQEIFEAVGVRSTRLSCTTPELGEVWNEVHPDAPWTYSSAERNPWLRALLRAELDAIVADLYGLSVPEYARVLTGFPLLDRGQPPLPGDVFVTEATSTKLRGEEGVDWEETSFGVYERKPRSFITRDLALATYMDRKGYSPPQNLHRFFVEEVGLNPEGPLSRFRIGPQRDLLDRIAQARHLGAVAYVPGDK